MKALVCVKRVVDYNVKVQVKPDNSGVETENVKMSMNPFDEIALEEAIQLREKSVIDEVVVVSIGVPVVEDILRKALAMGADRAVLIKLDTMTDLEPLMVAKLLHAYLKKESFDCVLLGKQAIDDDCNQTGQMLAGLLDWPQATFASEVVYKDSGFEVTREVDGGLETIAVTIPCVITTDLRLNTPRFIALPNILRAKSKPLEVMSASDFGLDLKTQLSVVKVEKPPVRQAGKKYKNIQDFMQAIDKDGVLR